MIVLGHGYGKTYFARHLSNIVDVHIIDNATKGNIEHLVNNRHKIKHSLILVLVSDERVKETEALMRLHFREPVVLVELKEPSF